MTQSCFDTYRLKIIQLSKPKQKRSVSYLMPSMGL